MGNEPVPVLLRTSERTTFKRCRQRWDWAFNDRLTSRQVKPALRFGSLVHDALEVYYKPGRKRGPHPAKTFRRLYNEQLTDLYSFGIRDEDGQWEDAGDLGTAVLNHYIETYGKDDHLEIIAPEMPFQIDVHDKNGKYLVTYVGKMDAVAKDHSGKRPQLGFLEHKTATVISTGHLWGDEQAGAYWAFGPEFLRQKGVLGKKDSLDFVLYNFLRKAKKDTRSQNARGQFLNNPTKDALMRRCGELKIITPNKTIDVLKAALVAAGEDPELLGDVSKNQPPPHFLRHRVYRDEGDRQTLIYRVRAEAFEMAKVRAGKLPVYKNPTRDCGWDCEFRDMCEIHETGNDWESVRDGTMVSWDPYADHIDMEQNEDA